MSEALMAKIVPGLFLGDRFDTPDDIARMEKAYGTGNWRTGPNPAAYPDLIQFADFSERDINAYVARELGGILHLVGDESGKHYRVPINAGPGGNRLEQMAKSDDILNLGADAGIYNAIFGAVTTAQTLQQQNAWGAIAKEGYQMAGYRAKTAAAITSAVGIAEASTAGNATHPTYAEVAVGLKEWEHNVALSRRMELVAGKDDTILFSGVMQDGLDEFKTSLDTDLLQDCNTTANLNIESLDRVCMTYTAGVTNHSYGSDDTDIYSLDKQSNNTWANSYTSDASDVNRALTQSIIDSVVENCMSYWTTSNKGYDYGSKWWLTGPDTWLKWSQIEGSKQRFSQDTSWAALPGGLQQIPGQAGGFALHSYLGIKIVVDDNVTDDGGSRLMLLDGDVVKVALAQPISVVDSDHPIFIGHYHKANIYGVGELRVTRFKGNGMAMDLTP